MSYIQKLFSLSYTTSIKEICVWVAKNISVALAEDLCVLALFKKPFRQNSGLLI